MEPRREVVEAMSTLIAAGAKGTVLDVVTAELERLDTENERLREAARDALAEVGPDGRGYPDSACRHLEELVNTACARCSSNDTTNLGGWFECRSCGHGWEA